MEYTQIALWTLPSWIPVHYSYFPWSLFRSFLLVNVSKPDSTKLPIHTDILPPTSQKYYHIRVACWVMFLTLVFSQITLISLFGTQFLSPWNSGSHYSFLFPWTHTNVTILLWTWHKTHRYALKLTLYISIFLLVDQFVGRLAWILCQWNIPKTVYNSKMWATQTSKYHFLYSNIFWNNMCLLLS